jgi:hypothetical protein
MENHLTIGNLESPLDILQDHRQNGHTNLDSITDLIWVDLIDPITPRKNICLLHPPISVSLVTEKATTDPHQT